MNLPHLWGSISNKTSAIFAPVFFTFNEGKLLKVALSQNYPLVI
jgi:hypothetical protein